jgi:DNA-binding transcriptional LysR family regulator
MSEPSLLTHRHVEIFRAVMTAGSVTGAAQALFTSQPTISRELSRMESLLRLTLFDRVRGRLLPTVQAYALFEEVQRSYAGLERVADTALRLRQFTEGQLSLACLPAFAHALLPGACARFQAAHPGVSVSVNPVESPLLEERLAARDFAGQAFVSFHPRDRYRQGVDKVFAEAGIDRQLAVETDSAVAVCAMVRHGLGLAIVNPLTALALGGPNAGIEVRPLAFSIPFRVFSVRPAHRPGNPLVARFEAALQAECGALRDTVTRAWGRVRRG